MARNASATDGPGIESGRSWATGVFAAAVVALMVAGAAALISSRNLVAGGAETALAYDRLIRLGAILDAVIDTETGSRGYVITGDDSFLEPFEQGRNAVDGALAGVDQAFAGDTAQAAALTALRETVQRHQEHLARTVRLRRERGATAAADLVASRNGKVLADAIRARITDVVVVERRRLRDARARTIAAATRTSAIVFVAGTFAFVGLIAAFLALRRETRRSRLAHARADKLNRTLEARVEAATEAVVASERRLRRTLDEMMEGCAVLDFDLRYLYVNAASARQGRLTPDLMIGRLMPDVYPGFESTTLYAAMQRTLQQRTEEHIEIEFVFPDGSKGWFELHIQPVPEGLFALSIETTERVRALSALRRSESRLRGLLSGLPEHVYLLDAAGQVLDRHIPGQHEEPKSPNGAPPPRLEDVLPLEAASVVRAGMSLAAAAQHPQTVVYDIADNGALRSFEALIVPDEHERLTVVARDVTARLSLEAQLRQAQKMEAVGQLTGGIAHDFNNVLTVILSNAELLALEPLDGDARRELDEILAATRRGAEMISRLLSFSRRGTLRRQPTQVSAAIVEFAAMLKRLLPAHVRLELGQLNPSVIAELDSGALEQMLANLITNARDAMPDGGTVRIDCEAAELDEGYHATHPWVAPGAYACVSVSDTGAGMDDDTKRRIFEPFFTTKGAGTGTGLGMAMVYGMMKELHGMVHIYSELGHGTVVKLYFPALAGGSDAAPRRRSDPGAVRGGSEALLLVEDEASIRRASRRALEGRGYTVFEAADGEEALARFAEHASEVRLIISDLVMPNLGGRQLAEALRAQGVTVPILFTSGYSEDDVYRSASLPPNVTFLHKPWSLTDLFARVRATLDAAPTEG